jgi:hypothetical protein
MSSAEEPQEDAPKSASDDAAARSKPGRWRSPVSAVLVVITVLAAVAATTATWSHAVIFDTDRFVSTVTPIIQSDEVIDALSDRLTDTVMEGLDVETRVNELLTKVSKDLPISASVFAAPITSGIRSRLHDRIETILHNPKFQGFVEQAITRAHDKIVTIINGDGQVASIQDGAVYLDLMPIVSGALSELQGTLSDLFGRDITIPEVTEQNLDQVATMLNQRFDLQLPEDFGSVKVFESDSLPAIQDGIDAANRLVTVLIALAVFAAIGALAISPNRRRTLAWLALGLAIGLVVLRRTTFLVTDQVAGLAGPDANQGAVRTAVSDVFAALRSYTTWLLVLALLIAIGAYLAGRPRWLVSLVEDLRHGFRDPRLRERREVRWIAEHAQVLRVGLVVVAAAVILFTDLGWVGLLVTAIVAVGLWFLLTSLGGPAPTVDAGPSEAGG